MSQLSQADEAALKLFYFHEQSIEEISLTMGWTASNTKSRLSRARQRLRAAMGEAFQAEIW
ncbi:MAG: sigma-70 region 4 domain-containing protein [Lewinellaceae bacterium]|nr:sigma-70 region 4 domain-containing protein [Lewinellaceae bacterium]